jgi:dTDP-4-amino-4,6-dideoxygalactose transaminase
MAEYTTIPLFKVFEPRGVVEALQSVFQSGRLATGKRVAEFEQRMADWLGVDSAVACSDASGALTMAMYLAGVRPNDEVVTSPMACTASIMPIANLFATPVWCDVEPSTGMPGVLEISKVVSPRTRAVLLYHWSGNVADVHSISEFCKERGIALIEDATEAFGATFRGKRLGGEADFTVYSLYATKHIHTAEGALLLAADAGKLESARIARRFGIDYSKMRLENGDLNPKFDIPSVGYNIPMNEISAAIGLSAIADLDWIVQRYQENGTYFEDALRHVEGVRLLRKIDDTAAAYWTYSLLTEQRDRLIRKLNSHGIGAQRLHLRNDQFSCFKGVGELLPGVERFDQENLSIPCGWWVSQDDRERIVKCLMEGW